MSIHAVPFYQVIIFYQIFQETTPELNDDGTPNAKTAEEMPASFSQQQSSSNNSNVLDSGNMTNEHETLPSSNVDSTSQGSNPSNGHHVLNGSQHGHLVPVKPDLLGDISSNTQNDQVMALPNGKNGPFLDTQSRTQEQLMNE